MKSIREIIKNAMKIKPISSQKIDAARKKAREEGRIAEKQEDLKDENGNPIPRKEMYFCINGCGYVKGKPSEVRKPSKHCFGIGDTKLYCKICKQTLTPPSMFSSTSKF